MEPKWHSEDHLTDDYIKKVRRCADFAFWNEVKNRFPEVKTGDFPPDATLAFEEAIKKAIDTWLTLNHPERTT